MPMEKLPKKLLPDFYTPPHSIEQHVGGNDTWESVAAQFNLDAKRLVKFNFHTNDTDEVNWYLRHRTGCTVPSPSGNNWTFRDAKPGIIYIPIKVMTFDDDGDIEGSAGVTDDWEDPEETFSHHGMHLLHNILEGVEGVEAVSVIFELGLPHLVEAGLTVAGPLAALVAEGIALGMGHAAALDNIKKDQALWGLSYGIVLGADKRSGSFVKGLRLDKRPVHSNEYPEQEGNFQLAYLNFLVAGMAYGRKMNVRQKSSMRRAVQAHMNMGNYPSAKANTWPSSSFRSFYVDSAIAFRRFVLQM